MGLFSQADAAGTRVHHLEAERWNNSETESPGRSLLGGKQDTVTTAIISKAFPSEDGSEEALMMCPGSVFSHNLDFGQKSRLPPPFYYVFPCSLTAQTSALSILFNQKSSHNLESQTNFVLSLVLHSPRWIFVHLLPNSFLVSDTKKYGLREVIIIFCL